MPKANRETKTDKTLVEILQAASRLLENATVASVNEDDGNVEINVTTDDVMELRKLVEEVTGESFDHLDDDPEYYDDGDEDDELEDEDEDGDEDEDEDTIP